MHLSVPVEHDITDAVHLYCSTSIRLEIWKISLHSAVNRNDIHRQNVTTVLIVANNRQLPINTALVND